MAKEIKESKNKTFEEILNDKYFESYKQFLVPILKKQVFIAKMNNDCKRLSLLRNMFINA